MSREYHSANSNSHPSRHAPGTLPSFNRPFASQHHAQGAPIRPLPPIPTQVYELHTFPNRLPPYREAHTFPAAIPFNTTPPPHPQDVREAHDTLTEPQLYYSQCAPASEQAKNPRLLWLHEIVLKYFVEWWMLEILSWCFSAICMAAIIGVLVSYNGQSIPDWPLGITINSFISIFSGFAKSSLLLPTAESLGQLKWSTLMPLKFIPLLILTMHRLV
jgi:hypothetical protein